jgi:hypothetical protein
MGTKAKLLIKSLKFIQMLNSNIQGGTADESTTNVEVSTSSPNNAKPNVGGCGLKPILFSTEMVKAILDGRKSQTRRMLKVKGCKPFIPDNNFDLETILKWNKDYFPYGKVGDILWVRETWTKEKTIFNDTQSAYLYRANEHIADSEIKWKPSIFMPYDACRLFLKVANIRVEKLNDISETDAKCEGIRQVKNKPTNEDGFVIGCNYYFTAKEAYSILWEHINGNGSYRKNPFVWVIEFERCVKP